ncbi:MAG TPA: hypothetical protein VHX36_01075 [Candidatus Acidoferrales bacterium]|nr:hypothetical protein [Candidatus Acidoferrales bacterium]
MRNLIDSLSLSSGAALIAVVSTGMVWLLSSVFPKNFRLAWILVVPFGLAYSLYWSPVWLGASPDEYHVWSVLCIGTWFLAGAIPSAVLVWVLGRKKSSVSH